MLNSKIFDEITRKISKELPNDFQNIQEDFEKNLRSALEKTFKKLNLVTREEFEIQQAVLKRSRERLEELEQRIKEFEKNS
tara:strand:+ start:197 stop:439 length:243 start_codon:yes stop_codon:yes gene_type:complete